MTKLSHDREKGEDFFAGNYSSLLPIIPLFIQIINLQTDVIIGQQRHPNHNKTPDTL